MDRHSRTALGQRNEIFKEGDEEGKKKTKKLLDKTRLFQTISQPRIYLQTDFFFLSKDHQIIIKRTWTSYIFMLQSSRSVCLF